MIALLQPRNFPEFVTLGLVVAGLNTLVLRRASSFAQAVNDGEARFLARKAGSTRAIAPPDTAEAAR